jgi:hypothetical protein
MASQKPTTERITVNRQYRTDASQPGGGVMNLRLMLTGGPGYGWVAGVANIGQSGVRVAGDDVSGDLAVTGMYAFLGDKQRQSVAVTLDSTTQPPFGAQTITGQMLLSSDLKTGYATFTYTSKGDRAITTVENVKVNAVKTESPKE